MCGIVGYTGKKQATPILLDGLHRLEYRGYDSSGVAVVGRDGKIEIVKAQGRLDSLVEKTQGVHPYGTVGIGHTRWATHGKPSEDNAHPHFSRNERFAVVHNGIIENYLELREFLSARGFTFRSETDTEIVSQLLEYYDRGDIIEALVKTCRRIRGSYALGVLTSEKPDTIYAVRKDSPLVIGYGEGENYIASDIPAVLPYTRRFVFLPEGEIAVLTPSHVAYYDADRDEVRHTPVLSELDVKAAEKDGYPHFMLKEIYEQGRAVRQTLRGRITDRDEIKLDDVKLDTSKLKKIYIAACGSAYHAGCVGKYFIEKYARIDVEPMLASEFRYCDPLVTPDCLTVIVSQSGETADSLAALREAKARGSRVLAVVNVVDSSIAREADDVLYTRAGPEISVATTKGYTTQLIALYLLGIRLGVDRGTLTRDQAADMARALRRIPDMLDTYTDATKPLAQQLAGKYFPATDAYYIGRGYDWASALEGALKLKEISYVHAEAYAAGELKHGTISLIENKSLVVGIAADPALAEKTRSNIKEVRTRGAVVIGVTDCVDLLAPECDDLLPLPADAGAYAPVFVAVALQLFAYYVAVWRGNDVDKPRNLAKSVTVE